MSQVTWRHCDPTHSRKVKEMKENSSSTAEETEEDRLTRMSSPLQFDESRQKLDNARMNKHGR